MNLNFLLLIGVYMLLLSLFLATIEFLKINYVYLIGALGFISATASILIQLFQYIYIDKRIPSQASPFLIHSIVGYGLLFLFSILLYYLVEHTNIDKYIILYGGLLTVLIIWVFYISFFLEIKKN